MSSIIEGIAKDLRAVPKNLKEKAGGIDTKKLVLMNMPYILVGYFCDKVVSPVTYQGVLCKDVTRRVFLLHDQADTYAFKSGFGDGSRR